MSMRHIFLVFFSAIGQGFILRIENKWYTLIEGLNKDIFLKPDFKMRDQFVEFFKFKPYITNKYTKVRFYRICTRGICII